MMGVEMKKILSIILSLNFAVTTGCALFAPTDEFDPDSLPPSAAGATTVSSKIATSFDDAEERANGDMWAKNADLELVQDGSNVQTVGLRFKLDVPPGAVINEALIQFTVNQATSGSVKLTIKGEAADNSPAIKDVNKNVSSRSKTSQSVIWSPEPWTKAGDATSAQRTSNLSAIVQEIVDRPQWKSGNYITFIITGSGTRNAKSYDGSTSGAPVLTVTYSEKVIEPEPTPPPTEPPLVFGYSGADYDPLVKPVYDLGYRDGFSSVDSDKDGLPDSWEIAYGLDPSNASDASADPDQDLLTAHEEFLAGTNPRDSDSDGDGMPDGYEVSYSLNPLDSADALVDTDGDGYTNLDEYLKGSDPNDPLHFPVIIPPTYIVNVSWEAPDSRADGSSLNPDDIAMFTIYYGQSENSLDSTVEINDPTLRSYGLTLGSSGNYFFTVTTTDTSGSESQPSAVGNISISP